MCHVSKLLRAASGALLLTALAASATAQPGRVMGTVTDDRGQPIKGATVRGESPNSTPSSFTASTDGKGRFLVIGLSRGQWTFTAEAPGFEAASGRMNVQILAERNPPIAFALKKVPSAAAAASAALAARDLQQDLQAADALYNQQKFDEAIGAYRAILAKAPSLTVITLQIAAAYRSKKEYDNAIAAYSDLLKVDANNDKAKVGIGMTNLEKGDLQAAEATLTSAAESSGATREVFYNLAEVKIVRGDVEEAVRWYDRAAVADPSWGKPLLKIGLVALGKGDKASASRLMERVLEIDPGSPEAVQARAVLEEIKK